MTLDSFETIKTCVSEADFVLVGLGEEWALGEEQILGDLEEKNILLHRVMKLLYSGKENEKLVSIFERYYYKHYIPLRLERAYQNLYQLLNEKNYFIVSLTIDSYLEQMNFKKDRYVMPCGNQNLMQCEVGCSKELVFAEQLLEEMEQCMERFLRNKNDQVGQEQLESFLSECKTRYSKLLCEHCQRQMTLNTLGALKYREEGYLERWQIYMKWLQGTLNKKMCVIEAGAGMQFPSVMRWPFEKTVFYNQKASMFRIHEKFYQLTEQIADRAYGCSQNAVQLFEEEKVEAVL